MATAYIYLRVSTEKQGMLGLESQRSVCLDLWEKRLKEQYPTVLTYEEQGVSAVSVDFQKRPKAKEIGLRIQRGDCIIFAKMDRAFRSIRDALNVIDYWKKIGVNVYCPDFGTSADLNGIHGKILLIGLTLAAEIEGDRARQRTLEWSESQRRAGRSVGSASYGFKNVRHGTPIGYSKKPPAILQPVDDEQSIARWCVQQQLQGHGATRIARHLNRNGYVYRKGKPFTHDHVNKILRLFRKIIAAEKRLVSARKFGIKPWEFVTPDGVLSKRIDVPEENKDNAT